MIENVYRDLGSVTREAQEIYNRSRSYIASVVGNDTPEDRIRQRCMIATGDLNVADILRFKNDPLNAGLEALERGAGIYADIKMVEAGVVKKGHKSKVTIFLGRGDDIAEEKGVTRASAGVMKLKDELDFEHVSCVTGVDMKTHFQTVYHISSYQNKVVTEITVDNISRDQPEVDSIAPMWGGANWHEREAYDMFGIVFKGHPKMERLLLADDFEFFPMRKDFNPGRRMP